MSWKRDFAAGVKHFRAGDHRKALEAIDKAIENGAKTEYVVLDTRSAVFEKLGRHKDALKDARTTILLAPDQWQGYARAARLFSTIRKFDSALKMADAALSKVKPDDLKRRTELSKLRNDIEVAHEDHIRRTTNHWTQLPVELFSEIAQMLVHAQPEQLIPLLHVCKDWRRVIEDNPHLWNTLVLGRHRPHIKAKRWVERSNGNIQTLIVKESALRGASWDGDGLQGLRWDQLRICRLQGWDIRPYLNKSLSSTSLPSLAHYDYESSANVTTITSDHAFDSSWPIQHLRLSNISCSLDIGDKDIRSLSLSMVKVRQPGPKLPPTLETLVVHASALHGVDLPDEFPDLHTIDLRLPVAEVLPILLGPLPQLRVLKLDGCQRPLEAHFKAICANTSGLTTLVLKSIPLPNAQSIIDLLRCNPSLQVLHFASISSKLVPIIEALIPPTPLPDAQGQPVDVLCPMLSDLMFSQCLDISTGPVRRLVRARNVSPPPEVEVQKIVSLNVDGCDKIEADFLPWFRANVERFSCQYWTKKSGRYRAAG